MVAVALLVLELFVSARLFVGDDLSEDDPLLLLVTFGQIVWKMTLASAVAESNAPEVAEVLKK